MTAEDLGRKFPTPDAEFGLGAQLSLDLNAYIEEHNARRAETFVAFDVSCPVLVAGQALIVDWYLNDVVVSAARVTVSIGQFKGTTTYTMNLMENDRLLPQLVQVPSSLVPTALTMAARGS
jgi:hypothetical protein